LSNRNFSIYPEKAMTPRDLRKALEDGEWTATQRRPPEWGPWRRQRMQVAIRCATLFLLHGHTWTEIVSKVGREQMFVKKKLTRQRVSQYLRKGTSFLLERGMFQPVGKEVKRGKK
jgi:hypothetical protein